MGPRFDSGFAHSFVFLMFWTYFSASSFFLLFSFFFPSFFLLFSFSCANWPVTAVGSFSLKLAKIFFSFVNTCAELSSCSISPVYGYFGISTHTCM
ncbi:hypothetical protein BD289DRAFT_36052 [Coniella lustricola]|uniref:Uncharacterized protein n=1 Tax=Coniella lustricola TaxID=2025994 RepID=A0A2T3A278_9PEZI|nr:hypothetical protein BD289DRAFT_36052 [Coniella lustricola]